MKRDATGKFVSNWDSETKQRVSVSLTRSAWRLLDEEAQKRGISRSEVIEHFARSLKAGASPVELKNNGVASKKIPPTDLQLLFNDQLNGTSRAQQLEHTETKRVEAVREAERKVANILETIADAFVAFDRNWCYTYVNRAAAQILQRTPQELIGKHVWREVFPKEVGGLAYRELHRAVAQQVPVSWEEFGQPVQRWLDVNAYPSDEGVALYFRDITQRKQAEVERERLLQELETERARFEAVLRQMPAGVMIADAASGKLVLTNEQAKQILGYRYEQSLEFSEYQPIVPFGAFRADGQLYALEDYPLVRSLTRGEVISNEEMELRTSDGSCIFINVNSAPILDTQEQIVAAVVVFQDVSDACRQAAQRKQLEAELRRREQQFKTLAENAPDIIARFDRNLCHVYVSPAIERHTGLPASAFIGKNHHELGMPEKIHHLWQQQMRATFATRQACRFEFDFPASDGTRYYQTQMVPEVAADGTVESLMGITRDVTDYKRVEQALRQSEERYRSLVESLPQLVCMTDADGMVNYCNQSWIDYTGLTLEQTQDTRWEQAFHPDDLPLTLARWAEALKNGNAYSIEFRIKRLDGVYRWHLNRIVPIQSKDNRIVGWLCTATDIHDQKRTEQRERFLAQASQTFAAANLDLQTLLDSITRLVSELRGDVCVLNLLSEDGEWLNHASCYHVDPEVQEFVSELLARYPRRADEGIGGRVMQTGEPLLMPVTLQEEFRAAIKPEYQRYLERFQVRSTLIVPLKARGQAIGVLSLTRHHPAEPHDQDDLRLFQDLADRAAMALANAKLYQQAQQARQQAEQTADRTAGLQSVTAALSEPLTPAQVAEVIAKQSLAVLHASSAVVALLNENGTELEIIYSVGYPQEIPEAWRHFPITTPVPLAEAVRTGQPIWEESTQERIARYPHLVENYAQLNYAAWISLPLMVEGRAVGGISINFAQFSPLSDDDRAFMRALSQQCAQAIIRAQLYEAEQRARTEAETANRVKDEFLAVLSHELRTPMNPILGWTKLLRAGKLDAGKTAMALETIERNAKLQTQLIEDLLDVSRILQGKMALNACPVHLVSTIEAAIETLRLAAQTKGIQIQTKLDSTVEPIFGDPGRLQQILWNLLSNAVKFTPSGGRVEVRLQQLKVGRDLTLADSLPLPYLPQRLYKEVERWDDHLQPATSYAQIQIKDTGKGINPDFLPHVFEYFRQADSTTTRQFGGLGLGLAIVRHLVELHGGTVRAESPGEGQGATFTVLLPQTVTVSKTFPNDQPSTTTDDLRGLRILVVDDEADMRDLVDFILSTCGANVRSAASAAEALLVLNQFQPDVLVSDIGMSQVDGYTLMRQVRAMAPEQGGQIPAIALTAYAGELNQQQALAAGFQMHISKPVEPTELVEAIVTLVKTGSFA